MARVHAWFYISVNLESWYALCDMTLCRYQSMIFLLKLSNVLTEGNVVFVGADVDRVTVLFFGKYQFSHEAVRS